MAAPVQHIVKFDASSERPLYEQMSAQIVSAIESGRLKPGDRLPSLEEWSSALGVGSWVPRRAMSELAKNGLVDIRRHMGAVVSASVSRPMKGKVIYLSVDRGNIYARGVFSFNFGEALIRAGYRYERVSVAGRRQDRAGHGHEQVCVEFPTIGGLDGGARAFDYLVEVQKRGDGGEWRAVTSRSVFSHGALLPAARDERTCRCVFAAAHLPSGEVRFLVRPRGEWGALGAPIYRAGKYHSTISPLHSGF